MEKLVIPTSWETSSLRHKLGLVWGAVEIVSMSFLLEDEELIEMLRNGATQEEAIEFVNENY